MTYFMNCPAPNCVVGGGHISNEQYAKTA